MNGYKRKILLFLVCLAVFQWPSYSAGQEAKAESDQKKKAGEVKKEDLEVIEILEILEILEMLEETDIEILEELEVLEGLQGEE